jgi:hypothetical protein
MSVDKLNRGVIMPKKVRVTDWVAGAETGVSYVEVNLSGDWTTYLPTEEVQWLGFETYACVSFAALNVIETQVNFMSARGLISKSTMQKLRNWGFFDENGKFNCSDRFTAKVSGTKYTGSSKGNGLTQVWDSIRHHDDGSGFGLVPESMWPSKGVKTVDEFYKEIPQEVLDFAKNIWEIFDFKYDWVVPGNCGIPDLNLIKKHLKQTPLQVAAPCCSKDSKNIFIPCGTCVPQHSTTIYLVDDYIEDFDHYTPNFRNKYSTQYPFPWILKGVVSLKSEIIVDNTFNHAFYIDINLNETSDEVKWLQKGLKILGFFPQNVLETGYYGPITQQAVFAFQKQYKVANSVILWWNQGKYVGSSTRSALNKALNK